MKVEQLRRLQDQPLKRRRVLVRADFNVPLQNGQVLDDGRLRAALPTLRYLLDHGAAVAVASHLGRPQGVEDGLRLRPVAARLAQLLERRVRPVPDCVGPPVQAALEALGPGEVALLENVRFHPEEKRDDPQFAQALAAPFDLFVQDAFGSLHRAHASTHAITRCLPSCAGLLVQREVEALSRLRHEPDHPFVAVIGGKKAEEKIGSLRGLLDRVDVFLIGGGVAYTFLVAKGYAVGNSVVAPEWLEEAKRFVKAAYRQGAALVLPSDVQLAQALDDPQPVIAPADKIPEGWMGLDIGPQTAKAFKRRLRPAQTIFWAGPLGAFEHPPFDRGTLEVAKAVADSGAFAVIGGGETGAAFARAGVRAERVFVSTGGGAALAFVSGAPLPGLEALRA